MQVTPIKKETPGTPIVREAVEAQLESYRASLQTVLTQRAQHAAEVDRLKIQATAHEGAIQALTGILAERSDSPPEGEENTDA